MRLLNENILDGLNPEQKEAAQHLTGPALTIATAGSGKTRTLISRSQYMIANGIESSKILLITFTNKAAREIKERIVSVVGDSGKKITVGTFHSICNRILRQYSDVINYERNFTILDEDEALKVVKSVSQGYSIDKELVKEYIAECKKHCWTPSMAHKEATDDSQRQLAQCYTEYQDELRRTMCMDFDDLLLNTVILLDNHSDILESINNRWQYISVDESQDVSDLDSKLIKLLAGPDENVFFVGDDNQAIYSFRGSKVEIIMNLKKRYPTLKRYDLKTNYRSTDTIVNIGKDIIEHNHNQIKKEVSCGRGVEGSKAFVVKCKNQKEQAMKVAAYIKTMHNKGLEYKEMAVLYRMSYLSRNIEKALMDAKIKYNLYGGVPFFCRMEIQDVLSYARLTVNDKDFQAFKRAVSVPKRGVGDKTIENINIFCAENDLSIREALDREDLPVKGKAKAALKDFNDMLKHYDKIKVEMSPREFLQQILLTSGYYTYITEKYKADERTERLENLEELITVAEEYDNIEELLMQASLYHEEINEEEDAVNLMTIHKSKGLEFEMVIIIDMCEGTVPHYKALQDAKQLEEERRLMFVATTRAKNFLFLMYPTIQMVQGQSKYSSPSRFIKEIDERRITKF